MAKVTAASCGGKSSRPSSKSSLCRRRARSRGMAKWGVCRRRVAVHRQFIIQCTPSPKEGSSATLQLTARKARHAYQKIARAIAAWSQLSGMRWPGMTSATHIGLLSVRPCASRGNGQVARTTAVRATWAERCSCLDAGEGLGGGGPAGGPESDSLELLPELVLSSSLERRVLTHEPELGEELASIRRGGSIGTNSTTRQVASATRSESVPATGSAPVKAS